MESIRWKIFLTSSTQTNQFTFQKGSEMNMAFAMKKKLCLLLTAVMLFSCFSISTAAIIDSPSGDAEIPYITETKELSERIADIYVCDEYTPIQKQLAAEKLEAKLRETNSISIASANSSDYSYTLDVPYQYQSEDYFCGPATTRQTLLFFNVSNVPSQYDIADDINVTEALGVPDASYMIDYINAYIPNGHYLNVSGAYKSGSYYSFQLTDPFIGWVTNSTTGKYTSSAEDVYSVVTTHWFSGYWW